MTLKKNVKKSEKSSRVQLYITAEGCRNWQCPCIVVVN